MIDLAANIVHEMPYSHELINFSVEYYMEDKLGVDHVEDTV